MTRAGEQRPWSVPVALHELPEAGQRYEIAADEQVRARIAALAGLRSLPRLRATFDVQRHGADGVRVSGRVCARVGQTCVVTLEPIENEVDEAVDLVFAPRASVPEAEAAGAAAASEDGPEPLIGDGIDLGAVATEFVLLGIDPYPRKPGAVFQPPRAEDDPAGHPFAALAALKKRRRQPDS